MPNWWYSPIKKCSKVGSVLPEQVKEKKKKWKQKNRHYRCDNEKCLININSWNLIKLFRYVFSKSISIFKLTTKTQNNHVNLTEIDFLSFSPQPPNPPNLRLTYMRPTPSTRLSVLHRIPWSAPQLYTRVSHPIDWMGCARRS